MDMTLLVQHCLSRKPLQRRASAPYQGNYLRLQGALRHTLTRPTGPIYVPLTARCHAYAPAFASSGRC